jgi:NAD+ diphosphatase
MQVGDGVRGEPYFALDVAGTGKEQDVLGLKVEGYDGGVRWGSARSASAGFTREDAAIFGEARSMLDWNARNKVCVRSLLYFFSLS